MTELADRYLLQEVADIMSREANGTTIKAQCRWCKISSEYLPSAFRVVSMETTHFQIGWRYEFFCIHCREMSWQGLTEDVMLTLVRAAELTTYVQLGPDEIAEIFGVGLNPALTSDVVQHWITELDGDLSAEMHLMECQAIKELSRDDKT